MSSPYFKLPSSVSVIMLKVLLALLPGIAAYIYYFGPAILVSLTLATLTALAAEALMLRLRKVPVKPFLLDLSAVLTAWLLALSMPPLAPWWMIVVATAFAIVIAKQLYGGLGNNPFNPAMVGYAVMIISFPALMTQWPAPEVLAQAHLSFTDQLHYIFSGGLLPQGIALDAISMATPLDEMKTQLPLLHSVAAVKGAPGVGAIFGSFGGKGSEIVALAYLLGGVYLWQQKVITWHIPTAFIGALLVTAELFHLSNPERFVEPWFHLAAGGSMLCAFFIATDPVTGPTTPKGRLIFAGAIALLTYLIRTFGGYPDGIAFAVLLLNICVPLIDAYTQPPVFGKKPK